MPRKLRLAYFAHTVRSDWNNGNAHFLRGLMRSLVKLGHVVTPFEPETEWSIESLRAEPHGSRSLQTFVETYPELEVQTYILGKNVDLWRDTLRNQDLVIVHEWSPPELVRLLLELRDELGFKILFHDTHHRASSSPEQMERLSLRSFDGILVFGEALRRIYLERFAMKRVWTLHEAADVSVFKPFPQERREQSLVWIGNWGDGERAEEIQRYLLRPAAALRDLASTTVFGVRYPQEGLAALRSFGVHFSGYLPNLDAARAYAQARATVHVPRQQYTSAMTGIPTIRVFEALACGIPLVSAPWQDTESLFRPGDLQWAASTTQMIDALRKLLLDPPAAEAQAHCGLETILARHTCDHRAQELTAICEEVLH